MHVVAREPVGRGDQHPVDLAPFDGVAQAVEARAGQRGAAVADVPRASDRPACVDRTDATIMRRQRQG